MMRVRLSAPNGTVATAANGSRCRVTDSNTRARVEVASETSTGEFCAVACGKCSVAARTPRINIPQGSIGECRRKAKWKLPAILRLHNDLSLRLCLVSLLHEKDENYGPSTMYH